MLKIATASIAALLLAGCADTAVLRVVEYRAGTVGALVAGGAGIAVHQSRGENAFADVDIVYQGQRGTVVIKSAARDVSN